MIDSIKSFVQDNQPWCIDIRRHLHAYPELSFKEVETTDYIRRQLVDIGIENIQPIGETGLTCLIEGAHPGKTILLRADIDALPIQEKSSAPYHSLKQGVMHACGHDAHTAMVLLSARTLLAHRENFKGSVKILFQPAEETIPGGAVGAIKNGVLENPKPDAVMGQHVMPRLECGKVGIRPGKFMASSDEFILTIHGKGGHGAMPENLIDPVAIAGHVIVCLQQVISRHSNPRTPSVLSIGKITAAGAYNIIPDEVVLEGTFRTMDEAWRAIALEKIEMLVKSIAESMGGSCDVQIRHGYPYLHNDEVLTSRVKDGITEFVGKENVVEEDIWMASEDFAYYTKEVPSTFYLLGSGNESKGIKSGLHTPTFDIDEKCLTLGAGLMAWLVVKELTE